MSVQARQSALFTETGDPDVEWAVHIDGEWAGYLSTAQLQLTRTEANRAHVRALLRQNDPDWAAALETAAASMS